MRDRGFNIALSFFGVAVWGFLSFFYPGHLHAMEGNVLFLYTGAYAADSILVPGGLSNYISAFIVQFCYWHCLGALLISLLFVFFTLGIARFFRNGNLLPLAFAVPVVYLVLLTDSKWTISGLIGLTATVWVANAIMMIGKARVRAALTLIVLPFVWQFFLRARFFTYQQAPQALWWCLVAGTAVVCLIGSFANKGSKIFQIVAYTLILGLGIFGVKERYEAIDEEIYCYSHLVRTQEWSKIIEIAGKGPQKSPIATNSLNLALAMTGRLGNEMFNYYQSGPRSLVNFEEKKLSSEILFQLGFVNEAIHLMFEDMAGNPNRERGAAHICGLARFTSVNGEYSRLNAHYLATLKRTLFYRNFKAGQVPSPEMQPKEDFYFNYGNFHHMLQTLNIQRPENRMAHDYYIASLLLHKDIKTVALVFEGEKDCPVSQAQAVQMFSVLNGKAPADMLREYINSYNIARGKAAGMKKWSNTYWYYYNFR